MPTFKVMRLDNKPLKVLSKEARMASPVATMLTTAAMPMLIADKQAIITARIVKIFFISTL